jgi:hypothetical protein
MMRLAWKAGLYLRQRHAQRRLKRIKLSLASSAHLLRIPRVHLYLYTRHLYHTPLWHQPPVRGAALTEDTTTFSAVVLPLERIKLQYEYQIVKGGRYFWGKKGASSSRTSQRHAPSSHTSGSYRLHCRAPNVGPS